MRMFMLPSRQYVPYGRVNRHYAHSDPFEEIFNDTMPWYSQDLYLRPADYALNPRHCTVYTRRPTPIRQTAPWVHIVNLPGFEPSGVDVMVEGANVVVHARRQIQLGDDYDVLEARRSVRVPEGVDKNAVRSFLRQNGDLVLTAPYSNAKEEENGNTTCSANEPQPNKQQKRQMLTPISLSDLISTILLGKNETANKPENAENHPVTKPMPNKSGTQDCDATRPVRKQVPVQIMTERLEGGKKDTLEEAVKIQETKKMEADLQAESASVDVQSDSLTADQDDISECLLRLLEIMEPGTSYPAAEYEMTVDRLATEESDLSPDRKPDSGDDQMEPDSKPVTTIEGPHKPEAIAMATELESVESNTQLVKEDGSKEFRVELDLSDFKPESISVKSDGQLLYIEGESQLEKDGLCILQELHRTYTLPEGALANAAKATMTERGSLCVTVPLCPDMSDVPVLTLPQCA